MPYLVLPALIPDLRPVYDVYFASFLADPSGSLLLQILFPGSDLSSPEFRDAHEKGTLSWWHSSTTQYTFKCVDSATGEIVGMGLCDVFVKGQTDEERNVPEASWIQGKEDKERAETVLSALWGARERVLGGGRYIYVHAFAVHPDHQGLGAGSALVQSIVDMGNSLDLPVYLESSPDSERLYARKGFRRIPADIAQVIHDKETLGTEADVEVPLMIKLPEAIYGRKAAEKKGVEEVWGEWQRGLELQLKAGGAQEKGQAQQVVEEVKEVGEVRA
ncbi:hypothetical protein QBC35DRAFT_390209 [Podospora australis]|uniref:N-acetyltransferase domain-containing protein n=1 Tax=Podospora australis TaxID=1536484 RepID=A0AAN7AGJ8_9PEZI|nr:hypothetical protein QBC35DRAFT_390209 [Podospora australis]